jgi:phosphoglycerate dehydrogenase-like enzyme
VLLTPLTEATRGLIDAAALGQMRDGALLVNAARGAVVDTDALVTETASGRLLAVLDVTDPEPLPDGHPLWEAPGVLSITPHIGGDSPRANRLSAELAGDQLARFCAGEPLLNIVQEGRRP